MNDKVFLKFTDEMLKMAEYEPPKFDKTKEEIDEYINSLKNSEVPEKNKISMLKDYIEQKLSLVFNEYKTKYRQNDEIIDNINKKIEYDTNNLKKLEKELEEKEKELEYQEADEITIKDEIHNLKLHEKNTPTFYEKFTMVFFVIIAIGLAVLSAYEFSISLAKIEALSNNMDFNAVKIPWFKFMLFLFGSFSILIASKAINLIYEKFNYSKKFFITIASLAVVMAVVSATMLSFDKAFITGVNDIKHEIKNEKKIITQLNEQIQVLSMQGMDVNEQKKQIKIEESKLEKLQKELKEKNLNSIKLDMFATFIVLIAEIFAGATAWIYISEFDLKYNKNSANSLLKTYEEKLKKIESEKNNLKNEINNIKNEYIKTKEEIHRLNLVLSKIKTEKEIDEILENYKNSIYKESLVKLLNNKDNS